MLLLLLAGTPVTAPPRLNLAALLDFAKGAYQKWAARGHPGSCSRTGCPALVTDTGQSIQGSREEGEEGWRSSLS